MTYRGRGICGRTRRFNSLGRGIGRLGRAVPKGFRHIWKYHGRWDETKVRPGLWRFKFVASKGKQSRRLGSFGVGTKGGWAIKAKQYLTKTGIGKYQTTMVGYKRPLRFNVKKAKKRY